VSSAKIVQDALLGDDPERKVQANVLYYHRYNGDHHPNHYKRRGRSVIGGQIPTLSKLDAATKPITLFCSKTGSGNVGGPGTYGHVRGLAAKVLGRRHRDGKS
jgi:hypothetical protein